MPDSPSAKTFRMFSRRRRSTKLANCEVDDHEATPRRLAQASRQAREERPTVKRALAEAASVHRVGQAIRERQVRLACRHQGVPRRQAPRDIEGRQGSKTTTTRWRRMTTRPIAWLAFIAKHPADPRDFRRPIARIVAASTRAQGEARDQLEDEARGDRPIRRRVRVSGRPPHPPGRTEGAPRARSQPNSAPPTCHLESIVARVKASPEPYKNFDADELAALKQLGLADEVVMAMIEVTARSRKRRRPTTTVRSSTRARRTACDDCGKEGRRRRRGRRSRADEGGADELRRELREAPRGDEALRADTLSWDATICKSSTESSFPCPKGTGFRIEPIEARSGAPSHVASRAGPTA